MSDLIKALEAFKMLQIDDDLCSHQNLSLTFDFTRLRLGLQIGIFGIISQGSDCPELTL